MCVQVAVLQLQHRRSVLGDSRLWGRLRNLAGDDYDGKSSWWRAPRAATITLLEPTAGTLYWKSLLEVTAGTFYWKPELNQQRKNVQRIVLFILRVKANINNDKITIISLMHTTF